MPEASLTQPGSRALRAYRHGLTGSIVLLTESDRAAYAAHCQGFVKSLAPSETVEMSLCLAIADDRWRLQHAATLESAVFAAEITGPDAVKSGDEDIDAAFAMGRAWIAKGGSLALLVLYENRIQRRVERNLAELRTIQDRRKAALDAALEEADLLAQLAESKGEDIEPLLWPILGRFDFSTTDCLRVLLRYRNLREARRRFGDPKKPTKRAA